MTFVRHFLPYLFMPLTISLMLLLGARLLRRPRLVGASIVLLWISSAPAIAGLLTRTAEGWTERGPATDAPTADAIVVLSGGRTIAPGRDGISEWVDADRFFGGIELFQAKKAPLLVFTGARPAGPVGAPLEGDTLAGYARALGVPGNAVTTTGVVTTTEDEAREVAALLRARGGGATSVLLVTSAFHMSRARRLFERAGLRVDPFRVDFQWPAGSHLGLTNFLPSSAGLQQTQMMLHELYGRLFYRVIGS